MAKKVKKAKKSASPKKAKPAVSKLRRSAAKNRPAPTFKISFGSRPAPIVKVMPDEKPLTDSQIQKFRDILTRKRDELLDVVARKKEQEIQVGEAEIGDEADIATRSVEKEMLFELNDSEKQTIDMIEASLRKIEKGVFGRCESCRRVIPRLRLEVMPWARYCIRCQSEQEVPMPEPAI